MTRSTLNLLILFIMLISSFSGVTVEAHDEVDTHTSHSVDATSDCDSGEEADGCESAEDANCDPDDCSQSGECCSGMCICITSSIIKSKKDSFCTTTYKLKKLAWYYYHKYNPPFLDPSLKPPLFS